MHTQATFVESDNRYRYQIVTYRIIFRNKSTGGSKYKPLISARSQSFTINEYTEAEHF